MNNSNDPLDRLLRAAARHQPAAGHRPIAEREEAPFGFATRVAATWIAQRGSGGSENGVETRLQVLWLRRALLCAMVIMTASVGWSFKTDTAAPNDEMAIASTYDSNTDLP